MSTEDLLNSCSLSTLCTQGYEAEQAEVPASEVSAPNNGRAQNGAKIQRFMSFNVNCFYNCIFSLEMFLAVSCSECPISLYVYITYYIIIQCEIYL